MKMYICDLRLIIVLPSKMIKYHISKTSTMQTTLSHGLNNPNKWYALKRGG